MIRTLLVIVAGIALALGQVPPQNYLNQGVAACKGARFGEAVKLFQMAVEKSPADPQVRLYLAAAAYLRQYTPGADSVKNLQLADNADREFRAVLNLKPDDLVALESLASLFFQRAQGDTVPAEKLRYLTEAAYLYQRTATFQPDSRTAHYSLGVTAWAKFYPDWIETRRKLGMRPEAPGPLTDAPVRADLRARIGYSADEGIRHLTRALEIDPAYDDVMAYLNLRYRERAGLYDTAAEYQRDVMIADSWVRNALETKKAKMPTKPAGFAEKAGGFKPPSGIRVSGNVQAAKLIENPDPEYPAQARRLLLHGTVRLDATIAKDGTIAKLPLVNGHPLFVPAAMAAVQRWHYRPTLLNGAPVEVFSNVEVKFTLP
jgi:TonB family protein